MDAPAQEEERHKRKLRMFMFIASKVKLYSHGVAHSALRLVSIGALFYIIIYVKIFNYIYMYD